MSNTLIIIPSRMSASRLPGKPLLKINGKSIISQVFRKAKDCKIGKVFVATEDREIIDEIKKIKGNTILTSNKPKTGTDRIWEALKKIKNKKIKYIINLQGDEPLIDIRDIRNLNKIVTKNKIDLGTLAVKIDNKKKYSNKNIVKVVTEKKLNSKNFASAVNFHRNIKNSYKNTYHHIGIYQYSISMLKKFCKLKRTKN